MRRSTGLMHDVRLENPLDRCAVRRTIYPQSLSNLSTDDSHPLLDLKDHIELDRRTQAAGGDAISNGGADVKRKEVAIKERLKFVRSASMKCHFALPINHGFENGRREHK
jgi:hypothetical protein